MATLGKLGRGRKAEALRGVPLFSTCNARELAQVAGLSVEVDLDRGTMLTREGHAGGLAYVILDGSAEVVRRGRRIATLGPGAVVGELSLIDGLPRSASVRATSDLHVLELDAHDLQRLLDRAPHVMRKLLEALSLRIRAADTAAAGPG